MELQSVAPIALAGVGLYFCVRLLKRLQLSPAKHPSLQGHATWSRSLAQLVSCYSLFRRTSFPMSATEAVIQAVHLSRYHTGRSRPVRFLGAQDARCGAPPGA